jgi:putative FmdB family regulatory protein
MPIYEYQCQSCGKRTEQLQRMDAPPLAACPECGGPVKKLISSPAVQFKGSGWYVTDYARKGGGGGGGESKSEGGAGGGGEASSTAGKESKGTDSSGSGGKEKSGASPATTGKGGAKAGGSE